MFLGRCKTCLYTPLPTCRFWNCRGQATLEYAIVAGVMVAMMAVLSLFLATFCEYGERILDMIASDYP